jgi:resuscitation-promoting factor RpfB
VRKRASLIIPTAVALICIVGVAAFAYSARSKSVTLSVDGHVRHVTTAGATVGDVLDTEGLEIGDHDAVAPSLDAEVTEGTRIAVRFGRELELTVDGADETYWVTATSVASALEQIGRVFGDADLSASRSAPIGREGLDLTVKTEKNISLIAAGKRSKEVTTALTVGEALRDLDVRYDGNDEIEPGVGNAIDDGSRIRFVRVEERARKVEVPIPNKTVVRYDDDLLEGRERVVRSGRDGERVNTYRVVLVNGEPRDRTKVDSTVRTAPVDRVEIHGTKEAPAATSTSSTGGLSDAPCASGSEVESGLTANAISVHRAVCAEFPQIGTYGGLRVGDDGEHGEGRALDIMVSDSSLGDAIAEFVQANYDSLGVSEILWSQQIWTVERSSEGWRWMPDYGSATANHYDHVHVTVY